MSSGRRARCRNKQINKKIDNGILKPQWRAEDGSELQKSDRSNLIGYPNIPSRINNYHLKKDRRIRQRFQKKSLILRCKGHFDKQKLTFILEDSGYTSSLEILSIDIEMCIRCIVLKDDRVCIYHSQIFNIYVYWRFYRKIPKTKELEQFRFRIQIDKKIKDSRKDRCCFFFP